MTTKKPLPPLQEVDTATLKRILARRTPRLKAFGNFFLALRRGGFLMVDEVLDEAELNVPGKEPIRVAFVMAREYARHKINMKRPPAHGQQVIVREADSAGPRSVITIRERLGKKTPKKRRPS
jgi:hypothetical protein